MKYYLIAGEASGDLHGANLIKEIKNKDAKSQFCFFGGDKMAEQAQTKPSRHFRELAFMGIFEVLANLNKIKENFKICKDDLLNFKPDILILIDYPGFNLKMAEFAKKNQIKTAYYISPKIWVWKKGRIKLIKKYVDKMYTIFPFEPEFYQKYNYQAEFVGNPIVDSVEEAKQTLLKKDEFVKKHNLSGKPIISLLAGSRRQEINKMIPRMLDLADEFTDYEFIFAGAPGIQKEYYESLFNKYKTKNTDVKLIFNQTYQLLSIAHVAVVNSGTATLETALFKTPQVVCYKMAGGAFLYWFGYHVYGIRYTSLVNIILKKESVKELIQHLLTRKSLFQEMKNLLENKDYRNKMLNDFNEIETILGKPGASVRTAQKIVEYTKHIANA